MSTYVILQEAVVFSPYFPIEPSHTEAAAFSPRWNLISQRSILQDSSRREAFSPHRRRNSIAANRTINLEITGDGKDQYAREGGSVGALHEWCVNICRSWGIGRAMLGPSYPYGTHLCRSELINPRPAWRVLADRMRPVC